MTSAPPQAIDESIPWSWAGTDVSCILTREGTGPQALLLPALSSISTRQEMQPLRRRLAARFETIVADWPGFGSADKPRVDWTPPAMEAWLSHLVRTVVPKPAIIVAAGHAAGYVLRHYAKHPETMPQTVLIAPTWRGPFPTMMNRRPRWLAGVRATVDSPLVGPAIYALNLNELVIRRMARGHVYSDPTWLTPARMALKRAVTRAAGARFASVRFVTGALDPFETAQDARAAAAAVPSSRLRMIWGEETPRKSKAEMAAMAAAATIAPTVLPRGKLAIHEEFAGDVAQPILGATQT